MQLELFLGFIIVLFFNTFIYIFYCYLP